VRPLETLTVLAALAAMGSLLFAPQLGGRTPALALAAAAVALAAILHIVGPFRWQMLPAEALILATVAMLALGAEPAGLGKGAALVLSLAAGALAVTLAAGFPLAKLPAPTGPYAVGTTTLELVRPASDAYALERRLLVKTWHPAEPAPGGRFEPLWAELRSPGMPAPLRLALGYFDGMETHSCPGAPIRIADAPYPLVIYNHALVSSPSDNTLLAEELASRGFIVVAVSHRDHAAEQAALQEAIPAEERARDQALYAAWRAATDRAERARVMGEIYANSSGMAEVVRRRTADTAFVLDRIEAVLAAIPGAGEATIADLDRVGAVGFSIGGAVATRWCMTDPRCRAAANLDGGAFGAPADGTLGIPYLMLYAEATAGANDGLKARAAALFEDETFPGAGHLDFTDAALLSPLMKRLGALGPAPGAEILRRKNARVLEFFEPRL
jgi:predicted dienelactone hydrolase